MFLALICDTCTDTAETCSPRQIEDTICQESRQISAAKLISAVPSVPADPQPLQQPTPQFSSSPALLGRGNQGDKVAELQSHLTRLGYEPGPSDGIFGRQTEAAVRRLQTDYNLIVDGVVGPRTIAVLTEPTTPTPVLSPRSSGPAVVALQTQLKALGYQLGSIDGRFGSQTQAAVIDFQKSANLVPDGVVGPETHAALQSKEVQETAGTSAPDNISAPDNSEDSEATPNSSRELPQIGDNEAEAEDTDSRTSARDLLRPTQNDLEREPNAVAREDIPTLPPASEELEKPPTTVQPQTEWSLLKPFTATGSAILFLGGWLVVLKYARKSVRLPSEERAISKAVSSRPFTQDSKLPKGHIAQRPQDVPAIQHQNTVLNKAQTLVATLVAGRTDRAYAYSLVDDARGRFTLADNKLWMKRYSSDTPSATHTIVLRCTDSKGNSTDKVFEIAKQKHRHNQAEQIRPVALY